ncbi:Cold shock protein, CspA family [Actinopolyspora mzabensis]|uniref:Cold shock protein, CspA family n=1 Tax=Actinopolyspora mzabensis TaxID=995066 RepID=A0A1G8XY69_ACTMZ|nr:cold shock domain-containing protein [Actinopolyspora mzabensis]SDJ95471.1 Cold shock protein, CspA family [Actinopolyspora mzabensis]
MGIKGEVIRFDTSRGFGFVSPESGGEDVFVHVNDLLVDEGLISPGTTVEFNVEDGERGLKASDVRLAGGARSAGGSGGKSPADSAGDSDVLTLDELSAEITEALLGAVPTMTGGQVLQARQRLLKLAEEHGWVGR